MPPSTQKPMHPILQKNTLDDRREIHELLRRLSPKNRVRFLEKCCAVADFGRPGSYEHPVVSKDTYELARRARYDSVADNALTVDCYMMIWALVRDFDFDLDKALVLLVDFAKRKEGT